MQIIEAPPRTECSCSACIACCKEQPGSLAPGDLERIRAHQPHLPTEEFLAQFRSSDGALLVQDRATNRTFRVRTIVPLYDRRRRRCTFLGDDDRCTIHAVKPSGCSMFDIHMGMRQALARSMWLIREQQDEQYQELRRTLKATDHYRPRHY